MGRWKPGRRDVTRHAILDAAGRLFRERGYEGAGIADVMGLAGLTIGGFYAHFDSKDDLLANVLRKSLEQTREVLFAGLPVWSGEASGGKVAREVIRRYTSRAHRDHPETGCPLPAMAAEVGRRDARARDDLERYLLEVVRMLGDGLPKESRSGLSKKELSLALASLCVGGILLARAVKSESVSDAILKACRRLATAEVDQ